MTKEQWHQVRNLEEIPVFIWFEYYKESGGIIDDLDMFQNMFFRILVRQPIVACTRGAVMVNFTTAVGRLNEYYENKFKE